jgi:hypothetical protein
VTAPLVVKRIINYISTAHAYHELVKTGASLEGIDKPRSVGYGIGLCFVLFAMQLLANFIYAYAFYKASLMGITMRIAVSHIVEDGVRT